MHTSFFDPYLPLHRSYINYLKCLKGDGVKIKIVTGE